MTDKEWWILSRELWLTIGYEVFYQRLCEFARRLEAQPPSREHFIGKSIGRDTRDSGLPLIRQQLLRGWPPCP
jgi:hypothetical protein